MSYVERHLNPGERVVHRTTVHPVIFLSSVLPALLMALAVFGWAWVRYKTSEFAVTSSRVIIKVGILSRRTLELQLSKLEAIAVHQSLLARLWDYGTLVVGGTGGTKEAFNYIKAPLAFRRAVQHQSQSEVVATPTPMFEGNTRQERECPYCAEWILVKATRC